MMKVRLLGILLCGLALPLWALAWVELAVFDRFENLGRVEVVHFTMAGQGQAILAPEKQRAELEQR